MFKNNFIRNPIFLSSIILIITITTIVTSYFYWFSDSNIWIAHTSIIAISFAYVIFNISLWLKKKKNKKSQELETEEDTLTTLIRPLLHRMGSKPIYLVLGNKSSGKEQLLFTSNAIKPADKINTIKNDFFVWYESDEAVYIKPDRRLVYQEVSSADAALWYNLVREIIAFRPRKPFSGCVFVVDFEFLIVNEDELIDYTLNSMLLRLQFIGEETNSSLPVYLVISKLDKLEGFKEYVQFSPIKTTIEYLSIPLKDTKGSMNEHLKERYNHLVRMLETHALDSSAQSANVQEKKAILSFPRQFELCETRVSTVLSRISNMNRGHYYLDIRQVFFSSSIQGGRKYNLLAKSCSNYFNLPIIASEYSHLSETPYFTRFLFESQILPEADYAGENNIHLKNIQRKSYASLAICIIIAFSGSHLLLNMLKNNIEVMNQLINSGSEELVLLESEKAFTEHLIKANQLVLASYTTWLKGNKALDDELTTLNISRLEETTKLAYNSLLKKIGTELIPAIEKAYRLEIARSQDDSKKSLGLLKGYLMFRDTSKRDINFLHQRTRKVLDAVTTDKNSVSQTMSYLDVYLRTNFPPVAINMDLVRATRRQLLSDSNIDIVYNQLLNEADEIDLGQLQLQRAVGFDFNNVFQTQTDNIQLNINKIYTSTGFSTFYRPRLDLLSERAIADNWVLGLSNNTVPTKDEEERFKEQVRKKYTDDYISNWRNALSDLKIKPYDNIGDLTNAIDLISGPSSPLTTILKQVYSNTQFSPVGDNIQLLKTNNQLLNDVLENTAEKVEEVIHPDYLLMSRVEQAFRLLNQLQINETPNSPTPWEETITALSQVRSYIKDIADAPNAQMAALVAAKKRMTSSEADPLIRLKQIAQKSPEPVRSWLLDIVNQCWSVIIVEATNGIQAKWYSEIFSKFETMGLNKYPFKLSAIDEISLDDFELLFAKGGILDNFISENFEPFYDTHLWTAKRVDGKILPLSPTLLVQLRNYNVIQDSLINKSTNRFTVPFSAKVLDLDSSAIRATINISDSNISYYQGPSLVKELHWPPLNGDLNINIIIQDVTSEGKQHVLNENGQWAIYRLIGSSTLTTQNDGSFISNIKVSGRDLTLLIKPLTKRNPFTLPELYNFTLPKNI